MPDHDQAVDFRAGADARAFQRPAGNRAVAADLHIIFDHNAADLRNFVMHASVMGITKAV